MTDDVVGAWASVRACVSTGHQYSQRDRALRWGERQCLAIEVDREATGERAIAPGDRLSLVEPIEVCGSITVG
jgi:hypothetical protein